MKKIFSTGIVVRPTIAFGHSVNSQRIVNGESVYGDVFLRR